MSIARLILWGVHFFVQLLLQFAITNCVLLDGLDTSYRTLDAPKLSGSILDLHLMMSPANTNKTSKNAVTNKNIAICKQLLKDFGSVEGRNVFNLSDLSLVANTCYG